MLILDLNVTAPASETGPTVNGETAQKMLLEGNKRYKEMVDKGALAVSGGRYDLDDGNVEVLLPQL